MFDPETEAPFELQFASPAEVKHFGDSRMNPRHGPTVDPFKIDLQKVSSIWNKRLAAVFAQHFLEHASRPSDQYSQEDVVKAFKTHLITRRKNILTAQQANGLDLQQQQETRDAERRNRRDQRKRTASSQSGYTVLWLNKHLSFLSAARPHATPT